MNATFKNSKKQYVNIRVYDTADTFSINNRYKNIQLVLKRTDRLMFNITGKGVGSV